MDLHMPGLNGIEATRRIVADSPHIAVVVLTMFADDDSVFTALRAGARGYLLKGADHEQIRRAVSAAAAGEVIFGAGLATRVLAYFAHSGVRRRRCAAGAANRDLPWPGLTRAEQAVARLVATGRTNRQTAAELYVSVKTVEFHLGHIFDKLGIRSRQRPDHPHRRPPTCSPQNCRAQADCWSLQKAHCWTASPRWRLQATRRVMVNSAARFAWRPGPACVALPGARRAFCSKCPPISLPIRAARRSPRPGPLVVAGEGAARRPVPRAGSAGAAQWGRAGSRARRVRRRFLARRTRRALLPAAPPLSCAG